MLEIKKVLHGSYFLMFRVYIQFYVVVVHRVIHIKNLQFPKW